jgi:two-component system, OmpR family, phosphate regulon sensor histidine kinase PhoR
MTPSAGPLLQLDPNLALPVFIIALALAGGAIAASIAFALLYKRRTGSALRRATAAISGLAAGNLGHRVEPQGPAGARVLSDSLNQMAGALEARIGELQGERDKLSAVLGTMADGVVVINSQGVVSMLNQAARKMLNLGSQPAQGRRLMEVARDYQIHHLIAHCLSSGQSQSARVELLRPRRYLNAVASPLRTDGAPGVLLTLHDLTRARQLETSQREFVSNVSHELRNPLASIKALVETLEDGALERREMALDLLRRIHQDVDRMDHLVNDLLELSRLESGQLPLQRQPLDLAPVVEDVWAHFAPAARERSISLEVALPPHLPPVLADADRVRQVLINLVENSLKFTPEHGRITVSARRKPGPPAQPDPPKGTAETGGMNVGLVEILVEDTGAGISQEDLAHIFERFYKVDRSRHAGGTGLGLAIVKQIVEAHQGEVWARSQEGTGSTFGFTLPVAE